MISHLNQGHKPMNDKLTAEQFEQDYAEKSRLSVAELHRLGMRVRPCDCAEPGCRGWKMTMPAADTLTKTPPEPEA